MNGASAPYREQLLHGASQLGQIAIRRQQDGSFVLTHRDDLDRSDLAVSNNPEQASEIARYDDAGNYRALKTAPNLRHGWRLIAADEQALRQTIEHFYPTRLAAIEAFECGALRPIPLRDTMARQSGMYRVAARITDAQLNALVGNFCRSDGACLRTILWKRDAQGHVPSTLLPPAKFDPAYDQTGRGEEAIPLLCQEACNLLVAAARAVVKGESAPASS